MAQSFAGRELGPGGGGGGGGGREKGIVACSFSIRGLWRCKETVDERGTTWSASVETARLRRVEEAVQGLCAMYTRRRIVHRRSTSEGRFCCPASSLLCAQRG